VSSLTSPSRLALLGASLLGVGALGGLSLGASGLGPIASDPMLQMRKLQEAFLLISREYVDPVDAQQLAEHAVEGMLEELDPHSSYIPARDLQEVQESFEGSFGGVGIRFEVEKDTARVVNTIPDGPSEKAGLMAGDRIVAIEDSSAIGIKDDGVRARLKGPIGTTVRVTIKRPGVAQPRQVTITRGRVAINTVDASFMADDQTGYIRIAYFAQTTYAEFREHLDRLRAQGMKRLVLDLRDNPGGIMSSAVKIADELLPGGDVIVSTKSRHRRYEQAETATPGGVFETEPIIVLLNAYSASASEILAGALQDHDRALVVGQRSFGKGLVQTQFALSDGSVLQMTISRYLTPSGRLIQTPYTHGEAEEDYLEEKFAGRNEETFNPRLYADRVPDSLKFRTDHGRVVFGGGGILPDVVVIPDTMSVLLGVNAQGTDFRFARAEFERTEQALRARYGTDVARFVRDFRVDEPMWQRFVTFATTNAVDGQPLVLTDGGAANPRERSYPRAAFEAARPDLERRIKAMMARNLFGSEQWYPIAMPTDPTFREAMRQWSQAAQLASAQ